MHRLTAINKARKLFGPHAVVKDEGRNYAMLPEERAKARIEIDRLQTEKPEGWKKMVQELRARLTLRRFNVGVRSSSFGLTFFHVRGSGDSFEEAFAKAEERT